MPEPRNRSEALSLDQVGWTASMDKEIKNHESNQSWVWIPRDSVPRGRRLIKLVWVFKVKRDGSLKSRLCVQGCAQNAGVDYDQTWSGTLASSSLRALAGLAAREGLRLRRWDFVSAYLQGSLEDGEVVYCFPPPGYERRDAQGREMVCRVVKPIYGMAQAGRRWQRTLFPWLREFGFVASKNDPCVFTCERDVSTSGAPRVEKLVVGVYVDDLAVAYKQDGAGSLYQSFVDALSAWQVEDEGELNDLLGIDFSNSGGVVSMSQSRYIDKLIERYLPDGVPPSVQPNRRPHSDDLPELVADALSQSDADVDANLRQRYQSLVGALLYCATNTRPDVAYAVGMLCRCMSKPTEDMYREAVRALCYLHRTRTLGLRYEASQRPLHGYSDSDWAVKHSTSGWVFVLNQAAISWGSKKQKSVALSSCEAEIVAGSEAAKDAVALAGLSADLGMGSADPVELMMDNRSAIDVAYNPEHAGRLKHVDRRHFYIRELVEEHRIRVPFVATVDNLADFFTKPLKSKEFFRVRDIIMNVPQDARDRRSVSGHGGALRGVPRSPK